MSTESTPAVQRASQTLWEELAPFMAADLEAVATARRVLAAALGRVDETAQAMYAAWTTAEGYPERTWASLDVYTRHLWFDTAKEYRARIVGAA